MTTEDKREKALVKLAQVAREWYEATEELGYVRDDDRKNRQTTTYATLREVIRRNWDLLH